jgi:hypothetical protein
VADSGSGRESNLRRWNLAIWKLSQAEWVKGNEIGCWLRECI